jgi:hypothetical protein
MRGFLFSLIQILHRLFIEVRNRYMVDYINGMNLGVGFNTATQNIHPAPALDNVLETRSVVNAGGQQVSFRVELASSTLSLTEQLNVSARAALKYFIFGGGSTKANFLSSFTQNSFTVYVLVQVLVINEESLLDFSKIALKPEAAKLFANNPQDFIQQYGDSFVYSLTTGGEFIGVLEVESSSAAEFRKIKSEVSGKINLGLLSANAAGQFEQAVQQMTSSFQMKASILRQGGSGALGSVTPQALLQEALDFPAKVMGKNGFPYKALIIPYNHIPHPIAPPLDISQQETVLEQLGAYRQRLLKYQNDLIFASNHKDQFPGIDVNQVNTRINQITAEIDKVAKASRSCFADRNQCILPQLDLSLLENILPPQLEGTQEIITPKIEQDIAKLQQQVDLIQNTLNISNGNIGVGTTAPTAKLDIRGTTEIFGLKYQKTTKDARIGIADPGKAWSMAVGWANQGDFSIIEELAAGDRLYIKQGGNVGIGTTNPVAKLDVNGDIKIKGVTPFQIRTYDFPGHTAIDTGYPIQDWTAVIAAFRALQGDMDENQTGNIIQIFPYRENGTWRVFADFRTHNRNESWQVVVLFIRNELMG